MVVLVRPKYSLSCILCNEGAPDCDHTTAQVVCTKCSHLEYYNRIQHWESDPCERMCKRKIFRENKEHVHSYTADQSSLLWSWTLKGLPLRKLLSGVWVITITLSNNLQKESWVIPDLFTEILTDICVHGHKNIWSTGPDIDYTKKINSTCCINITVHALFMHGVQVFMMK